MEDFKKFELGSIYMSKEHPERDFIIDFIKVNKKAKNRLQYNTYTIVGICKLNTNLLKAKGIKSEYSEMYVLSLYPILYKYKLKEYKVKLPLETKKEIYRDDEKEYCAALYLIDSQGRKL